MGIPNATKCEDLKYLCEKSFSPKEIEKYLQIYVGECLQRRVQSFSLILLSFPPYSDRRTLQSR